MSWLEEQIKNRIKGDEEAFEEAFLDLAGVVMGHSKAGNGAGDSRIRTKNAMEEILHFYHVKAVEVPRQIEDINEQIEYLMRPAGIMRRSVKLTGEWWKDASGPMLGRTKSGDVVALMPKKAFGYEYFNYEEGRKITVNAKTVGNLQENAYCFYKPFPLKKLTVKDLLVHMGQALSAADVVMMLAACLAVSLLGLFGPYLNNLIFAKIIPSGKESLLVPFAALFVGAAISTVLMTMVKGLIMGRIGTKLSVAVESASMARVLSLPASFFQRYSSGDLASRVTTLGSMSVGMAETMLSSALGMLFSLVYIGQVVRYGKALLIPAILVIGLQVGFAAILNLVQVGRMRRQFEVSSKLYGLVFSLFSGIQKIKLAGAEKRAFVKWAKLYKEKAELLYAPPKIVRLQGVINTVLTLGGTIAIYYIAAASEISTADYIAFQTAYGMIAAAMGSLVVLTNGIVNIRPAIAMVGPLLEEIPEISQSKRMVAGIGGTIELNNVSFRYAENSPWIIRNLNLKIRRGEYLAVVGKTGCGKSTLIRLLLGFEKPQTGAVYYDGNDLDKLDLHSVRKHIGVVTQNGKLFAGDIYSNIVISAPWLGMDEAWEAAEIAGIADDIRRMPMGMHTMISEGGGGISGGQRQRLMIARAIAPKPRVLLFDEATSALDNITQRKVSAALAQLKSTRIVIAHRLSTIRDCDRIIVLDNGQIIEDGTYEELMEKKGYFADLVERQQVKQGIF
ncbi:MAG: NHLP bacteriocin export ABC transporter permease/ATPase subunit [Lachnospiraceae bacterium]|nr:NHLP bacteriocin export ABC transporter permease/ATPase subunit [Lachnospiraceae bacterium]